MQSEGREPVVYRPQTELYFNSIEEYRDFKRTVLEAVRELGYPSIYQFLREFLIALYMIRKKRGINGDTLLAEVANWLNSRVPRRRKLSFFDKLRRLV